MNECFWTLLIQSGRNNRENRDVSRDDNWRRIQSPVKHLRWSFLQKELTVFIRRLFLENNSYYLTAISANLFLNYILSPHYYLAVTLIANSKHVSSISDWFTLAAEYIYYSATIYLFKLIRAVKKSKRNYTVLFY